MLQFDGQTSVQNVIDSLIEKLSIRLKHHFALCIKNLNSGKIVSNKLTILDAKEKIEEIAYKVQAYNLICVFRFVYLPNSLDYSSVFLSDKSAFNYLYSQCVSDFLINDQLLYVHASLEINIRLVSLHMQQLYLMSSFSSTSTTIAHHHSNNTNNTSYNDSTSPELNQTSNATTMKSANSNFIKSSASFLLSGLRSSSKLNKMHNLNAEQAMKDAHKCVDKITKVYGLEEIVPQFIRDSIKNEALIKMLKYYFKTNQTELLPLLAQHFATILNAISSNDDDKKESAKQVDLNSNNIIKNSNESTKATATTPNHLFNSPSNLDLINLKNVDKKSINLKRTRVNEDLIKLSFLTLINEVKFYGCILFPVRETSLDYREINGHQFNQDELFKCMFTLVILSTHLLILSLSFSLSFILLDSILDKKDLETYFSRSRRNLVSLSPKLGICHVIKNPLGVCEQPISLAKIEDLVGIRVTCLEEYYYEVELNFKIPLCCKFVYFVKKIEIYLTN